MVTIAVAVTTAPRRCPTLGPSLASLRRAGYGDPVVVVADGSPTLQLDPRCALVRTPGPIGIVATWALALETLLAADPDVALICQDDVTWPAASWPEAVRGVAALRRHDPSFGYGSFYTGPRVAGALRMSSTPAALAAWYPTGHLQPYLFKHRWSGALGYAVSRPAARALLQDAEFQSFRRTHWRGFDHMVTASLNRVGCPTYTWSPSLVSHGLGAGNRSRRQRPAARRP